MEPIYSGIEYFKLYPTTTDGEPFIVSFKDTVKDINDKLKGIISTEVVLSYYENNVAGGRIIGRNADDSHLISGIQCIKTDIQKRLKPMERLELTQPDVWPSFNDYRYCMIQLDKKDTIDFVAIHNIQDIKVEDKHKSIIMTPEGEVSLYDICVNLKLFGEERHNSSWYNYNSLTSKELVKGIQIILYKNSLCFIKHNKESDSEHILHVLDYFNDSNVAYMINEHETFGDGFMSIPFLDDEPKKKRIIDISSFMLHIIAMCLMLCDHIGFVLLPDNNILRCIGRLAFPIFAFMLVEGFKHTHNIKYYMIRLAMWACLAELPYNLMCTGKIWTTEHQSIMITLLEGLVSIYLINNCKVRLNKIKGNLTTIGLVIIACYVGYLTNVDYSRIGIATILVFYLFNSRTLIGKVLQFIGLYILNVVMYQGYYSFTIELFGYNIEIIRQGLALLALIPIWLYHGRRGYTSTKFRIFCYSFYVIHIVVLLMLKGIMQL